KQQAKEFDNMQNELDKRDLVQKNIKSVLDKRDLEQKNIKSELETRDELLKKKSIELSAQETVNSVWKERITKWSIELVEFQSKLAEFRSKLVNEVKALADMNLWSRLYYTLPSEITDWKTSDIPQELVN